MKTAYIVVKEQSDVEILRAVLDPKLLENVGIVPAGTLPSVSSRARSLVVSHRVPVAVFVDSNSMDRDTIRQRRQQFEEHMGLVSRPSRAPVIVAVPELEAIFFAVPNMIEAVFGKTSPELMALGRRDPKGVFEQLSSMKHKHWDTKKVLESMSKQDMEQLRETQPIKDLTTFLKQVQTGELALGA